MKPYVPDPLPLDCLDVGRLIKRVGTANAAIARYDGLLQSVMSCRRDAIFVVSRKSPQTRHKWLCDS